DVARPLRFVNAAFGVWLIAAPWLLAGAQSASPWSSVAIGLVLIGLSLPRGRLSGETYGSWNRFVL
ncbi:MAG TPA: SPW repeat protein, partial [Burkholderiaceae bacterium]|nr:SPW repeat protein [Burkholderiaceae bacterium]